MVAPVVNSPPSPFKLFFTVKRSVILLLGAKTLSLVTGGELRLRIELRHVK